MIFTHIVTLGLCASGSAIVVCESNGNFGLAAECGVRPELFGSLWKHRADFEIRLANNACILVVLLSASRGWSWASGEVESYFHEYLEFPSRRCLMSWTGSEVLTTREILELGPHY